MMNHDISWMIRFIDLACLEVLDGVLGELENIALLGVVFRISRDVGSAVGILE